MGRFLVPDYGLDTLALSADPFFTLAYNLFGAVSKFFSLLIQIINSFMGSAANVLSHFFPGARSQQ